MAYDYSKLSGKIKEKFNTQGGFAKALGVSENNLSLKLKGETTWKAEQISQALDLLGIEREELHIYFFTPEVA